MSKKLYLFISVLLSILLLLSGCASSKTANVLMDHETSYNSSSEVVHNESKEVSKDNIKKIIKDATVYIEVKNADDSFEQILNWINANNGYEFSRNTSFTGKNKRIEAVFKLEPDKLDALLEFLGKENVGKITNSNIKSDDITDQYYDVFSRLENLKKGREQFLKIQEKAVSIDDVLKVQNELNTISGEIEALQGKINMWDKMVAESTVTITIIEETDPIKTAGAVSWKFSSFNEIINTMKNGFILTTNTLINLIIWLVIFIISLSPVIVIGILVIFLAKKIKKKISKSE